MQDEQDKKNGFFKRFFSSDHKAVKETASSQGTEDDPQKTQQDVQKGLAKTRTGFLQNLDSALRGKKELDESVISQLEEALVRADIGVRTAYQLLEGVTERVKRKELSDPGMVKERLEEMAREMLEQVEGPLRVGYGTEPFVVMVVGVNGSGKTTTIAKIAARHKEAGRKVIMAAGDTFRAAAVEQLEIWGERIGCPVIKGHEKADPSSVAYAAIEAGLEHGADLILLDTAGRLHTRTPLMDQLKKIRKTLGKKIESAPHETLLVIDASMGQNAILQAKTFNEAIPVTGLALTKLDGTSKGGVLLGIANELNLPVRYIGIGEKAGDLKDFNAHHFAKALFADSEN